jgi:hypothetical protein
MKYHLGSQRVTKLTYKRYLSRWKKFCVKAQKWWKGATISVNSEEIGKLYNIDVKRDDNDPTVFNIEYVYPIKYLSGTYTLWASTPECEENNALPASSDSPDGLCASEGQVPESISP